jgi:hypothetical protein
MATVVAIFYSLWYPEMSSALAVEWHEYLDDGRPAIAIVRAALLTRAVPLVVVSVLPAVVFAPEAAGELLGALGAVGKPGSLYPRRTGTLRCCHHGRALQDDADLFHPASTAAARGVPQPRGHSCFDFAAAHKASQHAGGTFEWLRSAGRPEILCVGS